MRELFQLELLLVTERLLLVRLFDEIEEKVLGREWTDENSYQKHETVVESAYVTKNIPKTVPYAF